VSVFPTVTLVTNVFAVGHGFQLWESPLEDCVPLFRVKLVSSLLLAYSQVREARTLLLAWSELLFYVVGDFFVVAC